MWRWKASVRSECQSSLWLEMRFYQIVDPFFQAVKTLCSSLKPCRHGCVADPVGAVMISDLQLILIQRHLVPTCCKVLCVEVSPLYLYKLWYIDWNIRSYITVEANTVLGGPLVSYCSHWAWKLHTITVTMAGIQSTEACGKLEPIKYQHWALQL